MPNAAHIHLMLNHIPVLGSLALLALCIYAYVRDNFEVNRLMLLVAVLVGALTVPVFLSGEPAEEVIEERPGFSEILIESHEDIAKYGLITTECVALIALVGLFQLRRNRTLSTQLKVYLLCTLILNSGLILYTAYLGGQITHEEIRK